MKLRKDVGKHVTVQVGATGKCPRCGTDGQVDSGGDRYGYFEVIIKHGEFHAGKSHGTCYIVGADLLRVPGATVQ